MSEDKDCLKDQDIAKALEEFTSNDDLMSKLASELENISPEKIKEAKKLAQSEKGKEILNACANKGIDSKVMRETYLAKQLETKGLSKDTTNKKVAVLITTSRQLKLRNIPLNNVSECADKIINSNQRPVELSCSRLAIGPLQGKTIKVWCDTTRKGKNRRLSKILGFNVAGDGLIIMEEGDLTEEHFIQAERLLA